MDIYHNIKNNYYDTKSIPKFKRICPNEHYIGTTNNFNFCPECGAEFKNYNIEKRKEFNEHVKKIRHHNNELMSLFKKDALEYCDIKNNEKADVAFDMAWERRHSDGLCAVIDELEELSSLIS